MSNPSTIWAYLALPNPAAGSIPYVDTDNASIVIDTTHFYYSPSTYSLFVTSLRVSYVSNTTPGSTIVCNSTSGRVQMAAGRTTLVVSNTSVTATSVVMVTMETVDGTALYVRSVVPIANQFTITVGPANSTGIINFSFFVVNN